MGKEKLGDLCNIRKGEIGISAAVLGKYPLLVAPKGCFHYIFSSLFNFGGEEVWGEK